LTLCIPWVHWGIVSLVLLTNRRVRSRIRGALSRWVQFAGGVNINRWWANTAVATCALYYFTFNFYAAVWDYKGEALAVSIVFWPLALLVIAWCVVRGVASGKTGRGRARANTLTTALAVAVFFAPLPIPSHTLVVDEAGTVVVGSRPEIQFISGGPLRIVSLRSESSYGVSYWCNSSRSPYRHQNWTTDIEVTLWGATRTSSVFTGA